MLDSFTTKTFGEEDFPPATTHAVGEEDTHTTDALGEEEPLPVDTAATDSPFGAY
jgi:hypothetical protein